MALATLSIDLVAQLASLQTGLDKAGRLAEKNAAQIEARYAKAAKIAAGIGSAIGAAFSAAGIVAFTRATIDGIDKLNDLSDATGATVENLSALEDIGARTGTSIDTVGDAVLKLNRVLSEAKPDSVIARQIEAIGLSVNELQRLDPAESLRRVAQALNGYADDGNKARLVQELFGKSVREVAPFLKDLAAAGQLNATVTTEQAKEAEKFNQELFALQKSITDVARSLTGPLVSSLNQTISKFREGQASGKSFFELYSQWVKDFYGIAPANSDPLGPLVSRLNELDSLLKTDRRLTLFTGQAEQLEAERKRIEAEIAKIRQAMLTSQAGGGRGVVNPLPVVPSVFGDGKTKETKPAKPEKIVPFVIELDETTLAALKRLEQTDSEKVAALRLELQALIELRPEGGSVGSDQALAAIAEELARIDPEARKAAEAKQRLDAILSETPTGILQDVLTDIELINAAFDAGAIDAQQWSDAVRNAVAKLPKDAEKPLAEISEFAQQAGRNIQDALGDTLLATMDGKFDDLEDLWKNTIKRMIAQAAAAQLGRYLLGSEFGQTGQVGGAIGGFFTWLSQLGARANGGPVTAGRPYIVGERGPEIMVPQQSGTVVPNGVTGATFNVIVQGDASANTIRLIQQAQANFEARMRGGR